MIYCLLSIFNQYIFIYYNIHLLHITIYITFMFITLCIIYPLSYIYTYYLSIIYLFSIYLFIAIIYLYEIYYHHLS